MRRQATDEAHRVNPESDALIVVDVQRDFCPGGALPVPQGDEVVPALNEWLEIDGLLKIATRDWHPADHCSFRRNGGLWPDHCVQGTPGAELHPGLQGEKFDRIVSKGTDPREESYSGFDAPEVAELLESRGVRRLWVGGLAAEYCVKATALGGRERGFDVFVIEDAIRGIDVNPGDCEKARREMEEAGVRFVRSARVNKQ